MEMEKQTRKRKLEPTRMYILNKDQFHFLLKHGSGENSWPVLPIPDKCFSLKNISNINENDLNYLHLKHQSYALRLMKGVPQRSGNVEK